MRYVVAHKSDEVRRLLCLGFHKHNGSEFFGRINCFILLVPIMLIGITYASILEKLFQTLTTPLLL